MEEGFPDIGSMGNQELKQRIDRLADILLGKAP